MNYMQDVSNQAAAGIISVHVALEEDSSNESFF